jgi:hypothetical protein
MSPPLVFIDAETTGLRSPWLPGGRRAWEIAVIVRSPAKEGGHRDDEFSYMVADVDLRDADPFALRVGRFHDRFGTGRMVEERTLARRLYELIKPGTHIVGAVPDFDVQSLAEMFYRHGLPWVAHYHLIDVEALAIGYLRGRHAELATWIDPQSIETVMPGLPWKSADVSRACGVEPASDEERHTALGDARWALRLYDAITGGGA